MGNLSTCQGGVEETQSYSVRGQTAGGDAVTYGFLGDKGELGHNGIQMQNIVVNRRYWGKIQICVRSHGSENM